MSSYEACYEQLALFTPHPSFSQLPTPKHEPYWDEITKEIAPEHIEEKWNPDDFGGTSFKAEGDQLTIFYDDLKEPPEPDDFNSIEEFEKAWSTWESVREQVINAPQKTAPEHIDNNSSDVTYTTSQLLNTGVRGQTEQSLQVAPEHTNNSSSKVAHTTSSLLNTAVREQLQQLPQNLVNGCTSNQKPGQKQVTHWVEPYWVERAAKKYKYYRYCWMQGRKINRIHIGSVNSNVAKERRHEVLQLISTGKLPGEIIDYLKPEIKN
ncbi:hypothetical protein DSM106972_016030 [Dulcicalothrix desertica PCC 7102]|uniref:Uncharacterized protein n=1 Tax=Dulcicalothrix desertica PCC 7102 TaxID=232991 RepID=A0A433VQW9_9CYAN|nr:hypothetical protein [Dulcicalothrix desertica]RUT08435.1 hypothetical protein DSM106972_016030 [Dulcicalothrix desertica PCC 7102]TWH40300.1 hypothetical protein CAL7102_09607 [Dulcicalothrix desertica PCC 7102]